MKCTLMNKNKEVMLTEYDSATGVFTSIYDVYNIGVCQEKCVSSKNYIKY